MWRFVCLFTVMAASANAQDIVRDQYGRLIELMPNNTFRVLEDPNQRAPMTRIFPNQQTAPVIPYEASSPTQMLQRGREGQLVTFQGYIGNIAEGSFGATRDVVLLFETHVVQQPYVVLDLSVTPRAARETLAAQCGNECKVTVHGHVEKRENQTVLVQAHSVMMN